MRLYPLWLWERSVPMRVRDELVNCVAFIGFVNDRQEFVPYGTGFCVLLSVKTLGVPFIATALHVIEAIPGDAVWVRVIKNGGGFHLFSLPKGNFFTHPDHDPKSRFIDLAATTIGTVVPGDPITWIRESDFATDEAIAAEDIGIGDEVVIAGMLFNHIGETENIPIARVGNIAAMRREPVPTDFGYVDAYLVEVRSISGLSGSPVFVHMGARPRTGRIGDLHSPKQMHYLLGVVHGYYAVTYSGELVGVTSTAPAGEMNTGIAIVLPASSLLEIMTQTGIMSELETWASEQLSKAKSRTD